MRFDVQFRQTDGKLRVNLRADDRRFDAAFEAFQQATKPVETEPYTGAYTVTPKVSSQVLPTAQKRMTDDMTILSIPYYKTSNDQRGETVYIGTEVEIHGD